jgi:hypothetical protein
MQFLACSQGTAVPAEYKYLESLCFNSFLFTSIHSFTNLYSYPNRYTYSQLDLYSLQQTSKCLPTTAIIPPLPVARPVLAAQSNEARPVPDVPSCKWLHSSSSRTTPTTLVLKFCWTISQNRRRYYTPHSEQQDIHMGLTICSSLSRLAAVASHIRIYNNDWITLPRIFHFYFAKKNQNLTPSRHRRTVLL